MNEYKVKYKLEGCGYITVTAKDEDDAMNEIDHIFCGDNPRHDENSWIDDDHLWDIEWSTSDVISVEEV